MRLEDFRIKNNLEVRELVEMIDITYDSYEKLKERNIADYTMHDPISDILFRELDLTKLCNKKKRTILNVVNCKNVNAIDSLYLCSENYIKKSISY